MRRERRQPAARGIDKQAGNPARRQPQSPSPSLPTSEPAMHFLTGYTKPITAMAASPDGKRLYSAAHGQELIWVWDLDRRAVETKLRGLGGRSSTEGLAVSPCGGWLAVSIVNCTASI